MICLSRVPASGRKPNRSSSWKVRPHAPSSASRCTASTTSSGGRVGSPNGSIARQPTVQSPNEKWSAGVGAAAMELSRFSMEPELIGRLLRDGCSGYAARALACARSSAHSRAAKDSKRASGSARQLLAGAGVGAVVLGLDDHLPPPGGEGEAGEDVAQPLVGTGSWHLLRWGCMRYYAISPVIPSETRLPVSSDSVTASATASDRTPSSPVHGGSPCPATASANARRPRT